MKWSEVPYAIEVCRDESPWRCIARVRNMKLAETTAVGLYAHIYRDKDASVRIIEAATGDILWRSEAMAAAL